MSLEKDWTKEDNISEFGRCREDRRAHQLLNRFVRNCMGAIFMSSSGVMRYKQPGMATEWYLKRIPQEDADYIRKNLKAKHLNEGWDEFSDGCLYENDQRDKAQKYPRRGTTSQMKKP